jgi:hypothetical protein
MMPFGAAFQYDLQMGANRRCARFSIRLYLRGVWGGIMSAIWNVSPQLII